MSSTVGRRGRSDGARWAGTTAVVSAMVGAVMVFAGMSPRLWILVIIIGLVSAIARLLVDLSSVALPLSWYLHGAPDSTTVRPDRRVQLLTARLRSNSRPGVNRRLAATQGANDQPPADEIVRSLTAVLDDHLQSQYGIDRSTDAAGANGALGPTLGRFVSDPSTARSMTQKRTLASTIDLIEVFTASTGPT